MSLFSTQFGPFSAHRVAFFLGHEKIFRKLSFTVTACAAKPVLSACPFCLVTSFCVRLFMRSLPPKAAADKRQTPLKKNSVEV